MIFDRRKKLVFLSLFFLLLMGNAPSQDEQNESDVLLGNQGYLYYRDGLPFPQEGVGIREREIPSYGIVPDTLEKALAALAAEKRRVLALQEKVILLNAQLRKALGEITETPSVKLSPQKTYLVKKGDCLWTIAAKGSIYSDPYKWLLLYHANRDQLRDPDLIFPNMILMVPRIEDYEEVFDHFEE